MEVPSRYTPSYCELALQRVHGTVGGRSDQALPLKHRLQAASERRWLLDVLGPLPEGWLRVAPCQLALGIADSKQGRGGGRGRHKRSVGRLPRSSRPRSAVTTPARPTLSPQVACRACRAEHAEHAVCGRTHRNMGNTKSRTNSSRRSSM